MKNKNVGFYYFCYLIFRLRKNKIIVERQYRKKNKIKELNEEQENLIFNLFLKKNSRSLNFLINLGSDDIFKILENFKNKKRKFFLLKKMLGDFTSSGGTFLPFSPVSVSDEEKKKAVFYFHVILPIKVIILELNNGKDTKELHIHSTY